jgi:two-component system response regulator YesN
MVNVLVVDDEPMLVQSLYQMLTNQTEWTMNVFKALNGSEALEIARENRIDVMLSDICMPNIGGLELQQRMRVQWPHCRVIFLTGFDTFEFAQQAIRQNGTDYVLKVEGDRVILDALRRSIESVEKERESQRLLQGMKSAVPLLRREFVQELLQGRIFDRDELDLLASLTEMPLWTDRPVQVLLTEVRRQDSGEAGAPALGAMYGVVSIIDEYLRDHVRSMSVVLPGDRVLTLYQPKGSCEDGGTDGEVIAADEAVAADTAHWRSAYRHVLDSVDAIQESSQRLLEIVTAHAAAARPCSWDDIGAKVERLEAAQRSYAFDDRSILTDEAIGKDPDRRNGKACEPAGRLVPTQNQLSRLRMFIDNGDDEGLDGLLDDMAAHLRTTDIPIEVAREIFYSVALVFQRSINEIGGERISWKVDPERIMDMNAHFSWEHVFEYFKRIGESIICSGRNDRTACNRKIIDRVDRYVAEHLSEDLSLVSIAGMVHFHPSYLARLYKNTTGITLGQSILKLRLDRAKTLLAQPQKPIGEIAQELGFTSAAYFGQFFKMHCGMTPTDHRRQWSTSEAG